MDGTGGDVSAFRRRWGSVLVAALVITGCSTPVEDAADTTIVPLAGGGISLELQWEVGNAPITRSLFIRRGVVIAAGELQRDTPSSEAITAIDAETGALRWTHPLRSTAGDPQAVAFTGETLRIVAAEEGVYVSSYGAGAIANPIVGFAVGTGLRLFPSADRLAQSATAEEIVGAVRAGLVTSIGIVRDPATGVVRRLKFVDGTVLAIAGSLAFAWDVTTRELTGYDLTTDQPRWTTPLSDRPTVIVQDDDSVLLSGAVGWQRLDVMTGAVSPLDFSGVVDPLNSFDTCSTATFQSVPVGRYSSPVSCDGRHIAASLSDRAEVLDLETGRAVQIAVCDPDIDPFAVAGGLFACATQTPNGRLGLRIMDASSGFRVFELDEDRAAPAGLVLTDTQLIVSLVDGSVVAYRLTR